MNHAIKNGLFLGAALVIASFALVSVSLRGFLTYGSFIMMTITILIMVKTALDTRNDMEGFASFGDLFVPIMITVGIGLLIRFIGNYFIYNFTHPQILDFRQEISIEAIDNMRGIFGDNISDELIDELEDQNMGSIVSVFKEYIATFIGDGLIINAIISAIFQRNRHILDRA